MGKGIDSASDPDSAPEKKHQFLKKGSVTHMSKTLTAVFLGFLLTLLNYVPAPATTGSGVESQVSVQAAVEWLKYEEQENETATHSRTRMANLMVDIEGIKRWETLFGSIHALFPAWVDKDREDVAQAGILVQQNDIEIRRVRLEGFVGYPLSSGVNPYLGLGWSGVWQERTNFIVNGAPINFRAREDVLSWHALLGIMGNGDLAPRLKWHYRLEGALPVAVDVTNDSVPGFRSRDAEGYRFDVKVGADYWYSEYLSLGLLFYGGWTHWQGSGFQPVGNIFVKWPENDTYYLGGGLKISYGY